jgi:hypothetical protein
MAKKFEELYEKQMQNLIPTISSYFDKIKDAGMVERRD